MDNWVMTLFIFGLLLVLGLVLSMVFPEMQGASFEVLGTSVVLGAVSLILLLAAFVLSWIIHVNATHEKHQSEGIMTAITGVILLVFAPILGAILFVGTFLSMIVAYIGAVLIGGGMGKAVAASTGQAANTLTMGAYPRIRKRK